jgi:hypothetical protein
MRCLRIYATPDGESHFGEVDIAMTMTPLFSNEARLLPSVTHPFCSHPRRGARSRLSHAAG